MVVVVVEVVVEVVVIKKKKFFVKLWVVLFSNQGSTRALEV